MSRTKNRKAEWKSIAKRQRVAMVGGLLAIVLGLVALLVFQSQTDIRQTLVEDGERPPWQRAPLVNAKTGETFSLADYDDKHVVVKIMSPY